MSNSYLSLEDLIASGLYSFTKDQLRYHLHNRHKNGLAKAISKIGKRILFNQNKFEEWIDSFSNGGRHEA